MYEALRNLNALLTPTYAVVVLVVVGVGAWRRQLTRRRSLFQAAGLSLAMGWPTAIQAKDAISSGRPREDGSAMSSKTDERMARMTFASVYPLYVAKVEKKGRSEAELRRVIEWLTGFDTSAIEEHIASGATLQVFFSRAQLNPNAHLITGVICGHRVEDIDNPLTQQIRYLDKLVDELAKGRKLDRILRGE